MARKKVAIYFGDFGKFILWLRVLKVRMLAVFPSSVPPEAEVASPATPRKKDSVEAPVVAMSDSSKVPASS